MKNEIDDCLCHLQEVGFNVRAVESEDHASNVRAFSLMHKSYDGDDQLYIYHPTYKSLLKTYLFFDIVHLIKNIRNNLLNRKKFVFASFTFGLFKDVIDVPQGDISWRMFYDVYEKDEVLQSNLRKAYKLTYQAVHPANNKQDVPLALAIFDETTSTAIKSYFPE